MALYDDRIASAEFTYIVSVHIRFSIVVISKRYRALRRIVIMIVWTSATIIDIVWTIC